jgi:putative pyoverdin transport system ATP-binding/permease protein
MIGKAGFLKYIVLGILAGLFNFLFINFMTKVVSLIMTGSLTGVRNEYVIIFSLIILFYVWIRRTLSLAIIKLSQRLLWNLRKQLLSLVLSANYQQLSKRTGRVRSAIFGDVYALIDASTSIIAFCTSLIMAIACLIYLATISLFLFAITFGVAAIGAAVYHFSSARTSQGFEQYRKLETKFVDNFNSILDGFKEIYMEPKIGKNIYENKISVVAEESHDHSVRAYTGFLGNQVIGQVLSYLLLSSVLLVFSFTLKIKPTDIVSFVFTLLYLLGAIEAVMVFLPGLARARVAANSLLNLKMDLEDADLENPVPDRYISKEEFEHLAVKDLQFQYDAEEKSFGIGPVNFSVKKGDVIFIYGGNGSGKTTFIHSLLGIYIPTGGQIRLNDVLVTRQNYPEYRTIFSVVFSDFYLFPELLAIDSPNIENWEYYLRLFELDGVVKLEEKCFSTIDLSTGQRKRLALIAALLEEKPVLVIDEWAADQDPYFRKKFYTEILPVLKEKDFTVIAITHDDKYYHCADKVYKMEYGELVEERLHAQETVLL